MTRLTYDSNGKYPEEQSVQDHGNILPVLLHLVALLHDPGDLRYVLDALHGSEELRTEAGIRAVLLAVRLTVLLAGLSVSHKVPVKPAAVGVQVERRFPGTDREIKY